MTRLILLSIMQFNYPKPKVIQLFQSLLWVLQNQRSLYSKVGLILKASANSAKKTVRRTICVTFNSPHNKWPHSKISDISPALSRKHFNYTPSARYKHKEKSIAARKTSLRKNGLFWNYIHLAYRYYNETLINWRT